VKNLSRFLGYLKGYGWSIALAGLLVLLTTALTLPYPYIFKLVVDKAIPGKDWPMLLRLMGAFTACFIGRGIVSYWNRYLSQRLGMRVTVDLRKDCFAHLQSLSLKFYEGQQTGQIVGGVTQDTGAVYNLISQIVVNLTSDVITVTAVIVMLFMVNARLALATTAILPFFVLNYRVHGSTLEKLSRRHRRNWLRAEGFLTERVASARLVKSFAMEERETERFARAMEADFDNFNSRMLYGARLAVLADMISSTGGLFVLLLGGYFCIQGIMSIGDLVMFNTLIGFLFSPIVRLNDLNETFYRAMAGLAKIFEMLDTPSFVSEAEGAVELGKIDGAVEFRDVSFSYDAGKRTLSSVNLGVGAGQLVALVGPSGAGKTTLINLLCRFYDVDQGAILLDGLDIRSARLKSLRRQIGMVMQDNVLFSGTLLDNIRYGAPDATAAQVLEAARQAHAHEFIQEFPSGYLTQAGERGVKLSGGQKQRIAIARALLIDPKILIFDEATSALDSESEKLIQEAMEGFVKGRTTFVIAHRLSTILRADLIVVMEGGNVVEQGRHAELLEKNGLYRRLFDLQFPQPKRAAI
jgi:subfamily B ATP-binding cassette protein MsbA